MHFKFYIIWYQKKFFYQNVVPLELETLSGTLCKVFSFFFLLVIIPFCILFHCFSLRGQKKDDFFKKPSSLEPQNSVKSSAVSSMKSEKSKIRFHYV